MLIKRTLEKVVAGAGSEPGGLLRSARRFSLTRAEDWMAAAGATRRDERGG